MEKGDDLIVVAESLGALSPLKKSTAFSDTSLQVDLQLEEVPVAD